MCRFGAGLQVRLQMSDADHAATRRSSPSLGSLNFTESAVIPTAILGVAPPAAALSARSVSTQGVAGVGTISARGVPTSMSPRVAPTSSKVGHL